ncbi:hypothetical protein KSC_027810 [Ktedonobacter sp. SOSP1-52]|nr:hypothetical protein KSC_027810 [Ktedonobacter sp. SOSP1-52]
MQAVAAGGKSIGLAGLKGALAGSKLLVTLTSVGISGGLSAILLIASVASWLALQQPLTSGAGALGIAQAALRLDGIVPLPMKASLKRLSAASSSSVTFRPVG